MSLAAKSYDDERMCCVLEEPVYCVPVDINPAVIIPSVFLAAARQSLLPPGRKIRVNQQLLPSESRVHHSQSLLPPGSRVADSQSPLPPGSRLRNCSLHLKTIGNREKLLAIVLIIFTITLVSMITSVIYMFCNKDTDIGQKSEQSLHVESYRTGVFEDSFKTISTYQPARDETRPPCVGTCWTYSAFRFRSQCISGYCQCRGEFYNNLTCLPEVYGCKIESNVTEAEAFFNNKPQTVYTCSSSNGKDARNHVISTYGHHNSDTVNVDVTATSLEKHPITLILANYYPTKWRLNVSQGIQISKIMLMSNDHVTYSSVDISDSLNIPENPPRVRKLSVPVGYGDDRNGAHTVDLLKYITLHVGPVASFSGAHYADRWTVTLDRHDTGVTYTNMT